MEVKLQDHFISYETKSFNADYSSFSYKKNDDKLISDIDSEINYDDFITEDDEPLDNLFSERQQRLLPESLHTSWKTDKPFLALANVGIYEKVPKTPIVPDVLLSLDVKPADDIWQKKHRCYFISVFKKPPELVIEIVSNKVGGERRGKFTRYRKMGVKYYVVYDPALHIYKTSLHAYQLINNQYVAILTDDLKKKRIWFEDINIGLTIKKGNYAQLEGEWLRWYDHTGNILETGQEKAEQEKIRADVSENKMMAEKNRAEQERIRAEKERIRAEKERIRADVSENKMMAEKNRAEQEKIRAEKERIRAENAEKELALLKEKLSLLNND